MATTRDPIQWQLVFFSCIAITLGVGYTGIVEAAAPRNRMLPQGINDLPMWFLTLLAVAWIATGVGGATAAIVARAHHAAARIGLGVMFGAWSSAYVYGWLWSGNPTGFIAAGVYFFTALAVITPPGWTVKITAKGG